MPTILYAEDDRDCRELFAIALRLAGHVVLEAVNGAQAVQVARDESIDLAILDVRMPMMTGFEAARLIAGGERPVPIIFVSAVSLQHEVQKAFSLGPMVVDYLVKPISTRKLVQRVDEIMQAVRDNRLDAVRLGSLTRERLPDAPALSP